MCYHLKLSGVAAPSQLSSELAMTLSAAMQEGRSLLQAAELRRVEL